MQRIIVVTGSDQAYFLMGCMLVHSLKKWAPHLPVYYLDFGLQRAQRTFLAGMCTVLPRPSALARDLHPYSCKAAMGEFVRDAAWSTLVWLDSDMIALGPLGGALAGVVERMERDGSEVAACVDSCGTIGDFLGTGQALQPFADAVNAAGIALSEPYFNVGMVACRSRAFLDAWHRLTDRFPVHACFEQNAFNLLLRKRRPPTVLPAEQWNVHGKLLAAKAADGLAGSLFLHATSTEPAEITLNETVQFGPQCIASKLKLFRDPALRRCQEQVLMDFMSQSHGALEELGLLATTRA